MTRKFKCDDRSCGWRGFELDILVADNPFVKGEKLYACPHCQQMENLDLVCEIEGCWEQATCGTPTEKGYLRMCGKHFFESKVGKS